MQRRINLLLYADSGTVFTMNHSEAIVKGGALRGEEVLMIVDISGGHEDNRYHYSRSETQQPLLKSQNNAIQT